MPIFSSLSNLTEYSYAMFIRMNVQFFSQCVISFLWHSQFVHTLSFTWFTLSVFNLLHLFLKLSLKMYTFLTLNRKFFLLRFNSILVHFSSEISKNNNFPLCYHWYFFLILCVLFFFGWVRQTYIGLCKTYRVVSFHRQSLCLEWWKRKQKHYDSIMCSIKIDGTHVSEHWNTNAIMRRRKNY